MVLIAGYQTRETLAAWRSAFQFRLHVITPHEVIPGIEGITKFAATSNDAMEEYIASIGPVAAVIDEEAESLPDRLQRWQRFFFHVTAGGYFIAPVTTISSAWAAGLESLSARRISPAEIEELQASSGLTVDSHGYSITVKNRDHLVKVKDEDAMAILPTRLGANNVRLLGSRKSGVGRGDLHVESHGTLAKPRIPAQAMKYPTLTLREFRGPTHLKDAMLAVNGTTVLPSSFKHPWRAWNDRLVNLNEGVAALNPEDKPTERLEGTYYDLTCAVPGHFGHVVTESLSKVWGWDEAKDRDPGLKAIYRVPSKDYVPSFERTLFEAAGIVESDIHWEHRNVTVDRFVSASQGWQNGGWHYVHPVVPATWSKLRAALVHSSPDAAKKIFVSRKFTTVNRACRNIEEVESYFADRGFAIVYPEALTTEEQATVFGNATTVAGLAGSGMFNMLFAEHLDKVLLLSHDAYTARNEHMYASVLADEFHYFWSRADEQHPRGKFSLEAFHSAWEFDFEANGEALERVLR
ncbi:uncharacterized protein DUF563 [Curtobacterium sp. PhB130]|uniref:glycosyltransferase family 61 protein n=1 Tax=unclassified Curtobacterium TaxID=257496 RepID=UPI000FACDD95|nr:MULTISPECIES: glycosyltransferase 61 family protein [unclassified Curtobacterium]ROP65771.1 uncharacterized protein DUF563 [Curtobacterium sp. ZW137]ROS72304.1 uncharacterized protein DUF563 [Curtobacterium sp. PhB130]